MSADMIAAPIPIDALSEDDDLPWSDIDVLVRGAPLLKFGRTGAAHFREFQLSSDLTTLAWSTTKKDNADSRVVLRGCTLVDGQTTEVFRRQPRADLAHVSFSLISAEGDTGRGGSTEKRTLDVACKDVVEYGIWMRALGYLTQTSPPEALVEARRRVLWADTAPLGAALRRTNSRITNALKSRLKETADVFAWGRSSWGECAQGDEASRIEPAIVSVFLGRAIRVIAAGSAHAVALSESGEAFAWGNGCCGRLGTGSTDHELTPRAIGGTNLRFRYVACGDMHTLAISLDGRAYAWGSNAVGQLGRGRSEDALLPSPVPAFVSAVAAAPIAAGAALPFLRELAARAAGEVVAKATPGPWTAFSIISPTLAAVSAGDSYSTFLDSAGRLFSCGLGDGPLGHDGTAIRTLLRDEKKIDAPVGAVVSRVFPRLFISLDYGGGGRNRGGGGLGTPRARAHHTTSPDLAAVEVALTEWLSRPAVDLTVPLQIIGSGVGGARGVSSLYDAAREQVTCVSAGASHVLMATSSGAAWSWGSGAAGALGHGDVTDRLVPTRIAALPRDVIQVAAGGAHSLALVEDRTTSARAVYAFGSGAWGQVPANPADAHAALASGAALRGSAALVLLPRIVQLPIPRQSASSAAGKAGEQGGAAVLTRARSMSGSSGGGVGTRPRSLSAASARSLAAAAASTTRDASVGGGEGSAEGANEDAPFPRSVAAGAFHSAVLTSDDTLFVFGSGACGELGLTTASAAEAMRRAAGMTGDSSTASPSSQFTRVFKTLGGTRLEDSAVLVTPRKGTLVLPGGSSEEGKLFAQSTPVQSVIIPGVSGGSGNSSPISFAEDAGMGRGTARTDDREREGFTPGSAEGEDPRPRSFLFESPHDDLGDDDAEAEYSYLLGLSADVTGGVDANAAVSAAAANNRMSVSFPFTPSQHAYAGSPTAIFAQDANATISGSSGAEARNASRSGWKSGLSAAAAAAARIRRLGAALGASRPTGAGSTEADSRPMGGDSPQRGGGDGGLIISPRALGFATLATREAISPLASTLPCGPLAVVALSHRDVRSVACGSGFTLATVASEWMRDKDAVTCMRCGVPFGQFLCWRHHCRRCGGVFCDACTPRRIPLLKLGYIKPVRVCAPCASRELGS